MKGYKGFDKWLKCRGFQFEIGKTYEIEGELVICENGFHFCKNLVDVNKYYDLEDSRVCEVEAIGTIIEEEDKYATSKIRIIREIPKEDIEQLTDKFKHNTGFGNHGHHNSGNFNNGLYNSGSYNSGNYNSGNYNSGDCNIGRSNSGNYNIGNWNSGYYNIGNWNSGSRNIGDFNSGSWDEFRVFDKKIKRGEWEAAVKPDFIFGVDIIKTKGDMKAAWKIAFDSARPKDIELLLALPNFNKKVFKKITGIDLDEKMVERVEE